MLYKLPVKCPVCQEKFYVKRLGCEKCGSVLEGSFELSRLAQLTNEMQQFIIVFLECRGNIREMEKYFNISYPTVRTRIDEIVAALGGQENSFENNISDDYEAQDKIENDDPNLSNIPMEPDNLEHGKMTSEDCSEQPKPTRLDILTQLANGEIEMDEAQELLKKL